KILSQPRDLKKINVLKKMDNWKEKIITSIDGLERAQPPVGAFEKIQQKIQVQKAAKKKLNTIEWIAAAASIALILTGNILFISSYQNDPVTPSQTESYIQFSTDYNIYSDEN
ncbi:hypothetical protein, partial [Algoriphagus sp.]|uniref:hypothetical protein n=1 Tax=Algoriphagus sp. TaxID=1872435 RepID=UPI0025D00C51